MANDIATKSIVVLEEARVELHSIRLGLNSAIDEAEGRIARLEQLHARKSGLSASTPQAA